MAKFVDLTGKRFGRLIVLEYTGIVNGRTGRHWLCKCDCGKTKNILGYSLQNGETKSCSCIRVENTIKRNYEKSSSPKDESRKPEYRAYCSMKSRCNNPNNREYRLYGGRGILFLLDSYESFLNEVGRRPTKNHSIDRIDVNGNYEIGNLRWATQKEQMNNVTYNRKVTLNGITKNFGQWIEQLNTTDYNVRWRLKHGWSIEDAFLLPIRNKAKKSSQTSQEG